MVSGLAFAAWDLSPFMHDAIPVRVRVRVRVGLEVGVGQCGVVSCDAVVTHGLVEPSSRLATGGLDGPDFIPLTTSSVACCPDLFRGSHDLLCGPDDPLIMPCPHTLLVDACRDTLVIVLVYAVGVRLARSHMGLCWGCRSIHQTTSSLDYSTECNYNANPHNPNPRHPGFRITSHLEAEIPISPHVDIHWYVCWGALPR